MGSGVPPPSPTLDIHLNCSREEVRYCPGTKSKEYPTCPSIVPSPEIHVHATSPTDEANNLQIHIPFQNDDSASGSVNSLDTDYNTLNSLKNRLCVPEEYYVSLSFLKIFVFSLNRVTFLIYRKATY